MKRNALIHTTLGAALLACMHTAQAALLTGTFEGVITSFYDTSGSITGPQVAVSDRYTNSQVNSMITGTITIEPGTPDLADSRSDPRWGNYQGSAHDWLSIAITGYQTPTPDGYPQSYWDGAETKMSLGGDLYNILDQTRYQNVDYLASTHLYIMSELENRFLVSDSLEQGFTWNASDGDGTGRIDFLYKAPGKLAGVNANLTSLNISAVPVPAALPLMLSGLLGIIAVARKKQPL